MNEPALFQRPIAVTGGTGFIGRTLIDLALGSGLKVRALTRRAQPERPGLDWIAGDLDDGDALARLIEGCGAVFHCAGLVKALRDNEFDAVNSGGSRNLAAAVKAGNPPTPHFIMLSSLAAREPQLSAYARSKQGGEDAVMEALADRPLTILRPPAVYGPGDAEIFALVRAMGRGYLPAITGPVSRFSMIHVADLAAAMLAVANQEGCFGRTIEVRDANPDGNSIADVAAMGEDIFGRKVRVLPVPAILLYVIAAFHQLGARISGRPAILSFGKVRELRHPDWRIETNSLVDEGLWAPAHDLKSGLAETCRWYAEKGLLPDLPA